MALELVRVVELVVVKVDARLGVARLHVDVGEVFFEGNFGGRGRVEVDPDEAVSIDVGVYGKQSVLILVEVEVLVAWCFRQFAIESITPAMISTCEDLRISRAFFLDDGIRAVPADVVESVDGALPVFGDDEVVACNGVAEPVAGVFEARAVCHEEPVAGEDGAAFHVVHCLGGIP